MRLLSCQTSIPICDESEVRDFLYPASCQLAGKTFQQHVKIYHPGIGFPLPGYPVCTAGKRRGPAEDSGGPLGYENLLEALGNPKHEEHKAMREWIGEGFDPEIFSVDDVNLRLAPLRRRGVKKSRSTR